MSLHGEDWFISFNKDTWLTQNQLIKQENCTQGNLFYLRVYGSFQKNQKEIKIVCMCLSQYKR